MTVEAPPTRATLLALFNAALDAVHGGRAVERSLADSDPGPGPWTVLGAGKAAAAMAAGARRVLADRIRRGTVVTKDGHGVAVAGFDVLEAAHPIPDRRSVAAADAALEIARTLPPEEDLLVLLSGGASALWAAPVEGVSLGDKQQVTEALLRAGVDIEAVNTVRRHLSRIKGGRLAQAAGERRLLTLAVSDVPGDVPAAIGSGPTVTDPSRFAEALDIVTALESVPTSVHDHLRRGANGQEPETAKPGTLDWVEYRTVANLDDALQAVVKAAEAGGLRVRSLGRNLRGEARDCAGALARELAVARAEGADLLVCGGEPTVTVLGPGRGGRAQELALAFALEVVGEGAVAGLFAGTDGTDGPTDAAGAFVTGETALGRIEDAREHLVRNDAHTFHGKTGGLITTGPTDTNVTDLALIALRPIG